MTRTDKPGFFERFSGKILLRGFGLLVLLTCFLVPQAQTFEEFKKQIRKEYDDFEKSTRVKFDDFVAQIDKEFTAYLSDNFEPYTTEKLRQPEAGPKPERIPKAEVKSKVTSGVEIEYSLPDQNYSIRQGPILPNIKKTETVNFKTDSVAVTFLGWPLYIKSDKNLKVNPISNIDAQSISTYWAGLATTNYNHLLYQLNNIKEVLNLNDWAYYQLIKSYTAQLYPKEENMQVLLQWVLLSRSRYRVKIAYAENNAHLLVPTIYPIYATDFLRFDGLEYYVMNGNSTGLNTYAVDFPEADIIMDLRISSPLNAEPTTRSIKAFQFTYEGKKHNIKLAFNPNMIDFYKSIPLSDIRVYFNSVSSEITQNSIEEAFVPLIQDMNQLEAADFLLRFTQQAFEYKTDQEAFGQEHYFFAEELLNYRFSDCEDRSVFYAFLVKTLLDIDVLGIGFPGHMATALHFDNNPPGYHLDYADKNYVVADPTYYDASIGMLMPMAKGKKGELILTESSSEKAALAAQLWDIVRLAGGSKADLLEDVVFDTKGSAYVCGYFTKEVLLGDIIVQSDYPGRDVFVAKFNNKLEPLWINKASGPGNDLAFALALHSNGGVYLYGSVEDELNFGNTKIQAVGAPDVFVAMYKPDGQLQWAKKAGIDKLDHAANFMFAAKFNSEGKKIMAKLYSESETFEHYGLNLDAQENALITGSFYATPGMSSNDFKQYDNLLNLEKPEALKAQNDEFIQQNYEQTIAGLFAALDLINYNNFELKGKEVQKVFDEYNQTNFAILQETFYKNFGEMMFIKNKGGIIVIKTASGNPLEFNMIKIENEARIKIVYYESKNVAVQVFSGMFVGNSRNWLPLNSIKFFKEKGDVLFDYGKDKRTKKLNLKKEILKN